MSEDGGERKTDHGESVPAGGWGEKTREEKTWTSGGEWIVLQGHVGVSTSTGIKSVGPT